MPEPEAAAVNPGRVGVFHCRLPSARAPLHQGMLHLLPHTVPAPQRPQRAVNKTSFFPRPAIPRFSHARCARTPSSSTLTQSNPRTPFYHHLTTSPACHPAAPPPLLPTNSTPFSLTPPPNHHLHHHLFYHNYYQTRLHGFRPPRCSTLPLARPASSSSPPAFQKCARSSHDLRSRFRLPVIPTSAQTTLIALIQSSPSRLSRLLYEEQGCSNGHDGSEWVSVAACSFPPSSPPRFVQPSVFPAPARLLAHPPSAAIRAVECSGLTPFPFPTAWPFPLKTTI